MWADYEPKPLTPKQGAFAPPRWVKKHPWFAAMAMAVLLAAGVVYGQWVIAFADEHLRVLLPDDLNPVRPGQKISPEIAAFAGFWGGDRWDGGSLPHSLVVERITSDRAATVVYAWGTDLEEVSTHGWWRLDGRFSHGQLVMPTPTDRSLAYGIGADGRLLGRETDRAGWRRYVLLSRIDSEDEAAAVAEAGKRAGRLWREIEIPEHAQIGADKSSDVTLRATLYRTKLPGRQPLIVLNHGSSLVGSRTEIYRYEQQARFFLSLGYSVVAPMRRGYGNSGGTREEEERVAARTQIDAGLEDVDAVVEAMKAEPFVDPNRIVLVGYERGGLLSLDYAARFPGKVAAVLNFSGYWSPAMSREGAVNAQEFAALGGVKVPTLWLYGATDQFYPFEQARRNFDAFVAGGGVGRFVAFPDAPSVATYGSRLFFWTAKWEAVVSAFLGTATAPAGAGVTLMEIKEPVGSGLMSAAVYYPAIESHDMSRLGIWTVDALRDAPPRDGRFPLILLSPGYGETRTTFHDVATGLAENGFIVATVTHPGDDPHDPDAWRSDRVLVGREYDLRAVLDAVLADPVFRDHIDPDRIAAAGFGMGGYTALLLMGATPDFASFADYCHNPDAGLACPANAGPPVVRAELPFFRDARVKAGFLMAPGPGYFFTREGLRGVTAPVHIDDPELDDVMTRPFSAERIRDNLPAPPEYNLVPGAGHYIYWAPCPAILRGESPRTCVDPLGKSRIDFHAELVAEMTTFFRRSLDIR